MIAIVLTLSIFT